MLQVISLSFSAKITESLEAGQLTPAQAAAQWGLLNPLTELEKEITNQRTVYMLEMQKAESEAIEPLLNSLEGLFLASDTTGEVKNEALDTINGLREVHQEAVGLLAAAAPAPATIPAPAPLVSNAGEVAAAAPASSITHLTNPFEDGLPGMEEVLGSISANPLLSAPTAVMSVSGDTAPSVASGVIVEVLSETTTPPLLLSAINDIATSEVALQNDPAASVLAIEAGVYLDGVDTLGDVDSSSDSNTDIA